MPKSGKTTAFIMKFFNKLFDVLNGRDLMTASSHHIEFLKEAKGVLHKMRFVNKIDTTKTESLPSLKNLIFTIDSVLRLWKVLVGLGFTELDTRKLNQDPMENYFGRVRSQGVKNHRPTPLQFKQIAKALLLDNLTSDHSPGANCEADADKILFSWTDYDSEMSTEEPDLRIPTNIKEPIFSVNTNSAASIRAAAKALAGCIKKQDCETCTKMFDKDPATLVENLVNDTREVLKNVVAKIFTLNNVKSRAHKFLKREINFDVFVCSKHKNLLTDVFLNSIIQEYLNSVITYINRILEGKVTIKNKNQHSVVLAAHERYIKKLKKCNRPEELE